jgi:anti-anti-sigma factor
MFWDDWPSSKQERCANSISRLLKQGRRDIILNLSGLQFLDSSGIGELASVYVAVVRQDGQMKAIGLSSKIEDVLKIYTTLPGVPRISR